MRAEVNLGDDHLAVTLGVPESVLALRRRIIVPYSLIRSAIAGDGPKILWVAVRVGTHVPRRFAAGTFWRFGGRHFYFYGRGDTTLHLRLKDHEFVDIIVSVQDARGLADAISRRLLKGT